MKKIAITLIALSSVTIGASAQKLMTRTGKVTFFSSTPVENIEAFNNDVSSVIDTKSGDMAFIVPIKSFKFEKALMQEHFNENYMESDKFPKADFKGKITNLSDVNFTKDGTYDVKSAGKLTIHGVTKDVLIPGTVTVKNGAATATSKFKIKLADYGIKVPAMVTSKIAEDIDITVNSILAGK